MGKKEAIEKVVKVTGAVVRTLIGLSAAALVLLGVLKKGRKS